MKYLHMTFLAIFFTAFPLFATAHELTGPSISSNGAFTIEWSPSDSIQSCHNLRIEVKSNEGYDEELPVDSQQSNLDFYGLPKGDYAISLNGDCELGDGSGNWGKRSFSVLIVTVTGDHDLSGKTLNYETSDNTKNFRSSSLSEDFHNAESMLSTQSSDPGMQCSIHCPNGSHSLLTNCREGEWEWQPFGESCHNFPNQHCSDIAGGRPNNSAYCATNTDDFWTCDFSCPLGYDHVDSRPTSPRCRNGGERRCVINTSPPRALTLSEPNPSYDARFVVSWGWVPLVNYHEWKYITQSTWTRINGRELSQSGLTAGTYIVQVRACNNYGCSPIRSRTVILAAPTAPAITSSSTNAERSYTLSWNASNGAERYEWRRGNTSWTSTTQLSTVITPLLSGSHNFQVRACNSVECGPFRSITVTSSYVVPATPTAPAITSSSTNTTHDYKLTWNAVSGAIRYEWRRDNGSWASTSQRSVVSTSMVSGSYTFQVRACNALECGPVSSITVVSSYELPRGAACQWAYSSTYNLGNYDVIRVYIPVGPCANKRREHSRRFARYTYDTCQHYCN